MQQLFSPLASNERFTPCAPRSANRKPSGSGSRKSAARRRRNPHFRTLYNEEGSHLGVELARLLREGNVVAVQGDRVIFDVSPMDVEVEPGLMMRMPKGPLFLARATGAPCFPLIILREGWRRYRVMVLPELALPPRTRGADDEAAKIWAGTILGMVRKHWQQWYVFEPLLNRTG